MFNGMCLVLRVSKTDDASARFTKETDSFLILTGPPPNIQRDNSKISTSEDFSSS